MAADVVQAEPVGPAEEERLRAGDIGDRGRLADDRQAIQLIEQAEAGEWIGGEDDQVGAFGRPGQR